MLEGRGKIYSYTAMNIDPDGKRLRKPVVTALGKFPVARGGLVHKLGGAISEKITIGMEIKAVLVPEEKQEDSRMDIKYFKTLEGAFQLNSPI